MLLVDVCVVNKHGTRLKGFVMGDEIWEYYAKDMMFESHKEPHYVTQQYIKHLEKERDRLQALVAELEQAVRGE